MCSELHNSWQTQCLRRCQISSWQTQKCGWIDGWISRDRKITQLCIFSSLLAIWRRSKAFFILLKALICKASDKTISRLVFFPFLIHSGFRPFNSAPELKFSVPFKLLSVLFSFGCCVLPILHNIALYHLCSACPYSSLTSRSGRFNSRSALCTKPALLKILLCCSAA